MRTEQTKIAIEFINTDIEKVCRSITRFVNPIEVLDDRARVKNPLAARPADARSPSEVLTPEYRAVFSFLKHATRWLPANPNKNAILQKLLDTYVPLNAPASGSHSEIANTVDSHGNFAFDEAIRKSKHILVSGVRGCGKTAFLNYWLSLKTKDLEADRKTWFRIDASKVHANWLSKSGMPVSDSYIEYFQIHTLYVVFLYGGFFGQAHPNLFGIDSTSELFQTICESVRLIDGSLFGSTVDIFLNQARRLEGRQAEIDVSALVVQGIFRAANKTKRNLIRRCFAAVCDAFSRSNVTVIVIVDGIDNISWTKRNRFYQNTCEDLGRILTALRQDVGDEMRVIMAVRPETVHEIRFTSQGFVPDFNNSTGEPPFAEWRIIAPGVASIMERKVNAAKSATSFASERSDCLSALGASSPLLSRILDGLVIESKTYPVDVVEGIRWGLAIRDRLIRTSQPAVGNISIRDELSVETVIKFLFDDDVRAYIDNIVKVYFVKNRMLQTVSLTKSAAQRRLTQYIFLNGRPFYDSREHYIEIEGVRSRANYRDRGSVFPNIFWWALETTQSAPDKWQGLAGFRMLQCAAHLSEFCMGDLLHVLHILFGYSPDVLIEIAETFVACGLIDIKRPTSARDFFEGQKRNKVFGTYRSFGYITRKGRFLREYIWTRPDILYFYALDTPLHAKLTRDDTRYVRACREFASLEYIEDFYQAAIPTVATFLLHVKSYASNEMKELRIGRERHKTVWSYLGDGDVFLKNVELPVEIDEIFARFVEVGTSKRRDRTTVALINSEILGVLRGAVEQARGR